jgi:hypothetical protein
VQGINTLTAAWKNERNERTSRPTWMFLEPLKGTSAMISTELKGIVNSTSQYQIQMAAALLPLLRMYMCMWQLGTD